MPITAFHFWSPTCAPCKVIKPSVEDLKEEFDTVTWVSVNTHDDRQGYAELYNVSVVPTIVVVVTDLEGKIVHTERHSGTTMAAYYRILRSAIKYASDNR